MKPRKTPIVVGGSLAIGLTGLTYAQQRRHLQDEGFDTAAVAEHHICPAIPEGELSSTSTGWPQTLRGVPASEPFAARTGSLS